MGVFKFCAGAGGHGLTTITTVRHEKKFEALIRGRVTGPVWVETTEGARSGES